MVDKGLTKGVGLKRIQKKNIYIYIYIKLIDILNV